MLASSLCKIRPCQHLCCGIVGKLSQRMKGRLCVWAKAVAIPGADVARMSASCPFHAPCLWTQACSLRQWLPAEWSPVTSGQNDTAAFTVLQSLTQIWYCSDLVLLDPGTDHTLDSATLKIFSAETQVRVASGPEGLVMTLVMAPDSPEHQVNPWNTGTP